MPDEGSPSWLDPMTPTPETLRRESRWVLGVGLLLAALGLLAVIAAFAATVTSVVLLGVLLLLAGAAQLAHAFADRPLDFGWRALAGALYAGAGILLVVDPVSGAIGLTLLIGLLFLMAGVLRLTLAGLAHRVGAPTGWYVLAGGLDLLLALLILAGWPGTGTWVIGLFLGVELLFVGISLTVATLVARGMLRP